MNILNDYIGYIEYKGNQKIERSAFACPPWAGILKLIDRRYKNYKINLWRDHIDCKAKIF